MLVERLIAWAEGTGIVRKINLRVREDNTRAIRLYERSGFVCEGVLQRELLVRGQFHALVSMGREL
ncbi:MAG TPA: GNAT family N-acetyltransferase, partial [Planctomycetota bacterium]|nr:GNAT family N-acetyltransferase [Planctomycetota bacterium]